MVLGSRSAHEGEGGAGDLEGREGAEGKNEAPKKLPGEGNEKKDWSEKTGPPIRDSEKISREEKGGGRWGEGLCAKTDLGVARGGKTRGKSRRRNGIGRKQGIRKRPKYPRGSSLKKEKNVEMERIVPTSWKSELSSNIFVKVPRKSTLWKSEKPGGREDAWNVETRGRTTAELPSYLLKEQGVEGARN